jgi:heme iron utilization protein
MAIRYRGYTLWLLAALLLALAVGDRRTVAFTVRVAALSLPSYKNSAAAASAGTAASRRLSSTAVATVNGEGASSGASPVSAPVNSIRLNVIEKARTVTQVCTSGTLCTVSTEQGIQGAPFGSFVDYVLDDGGYPILLMNDMSMHTINIRSNPVVTLFTQLSSVSDEGQDVSRCSVTGVLKAVDGADAAWDTIRMRYSIAHTYADQVMDSPKFKFYRLEPEKVYFVGGFGVLAKWISPEDYLRAAPDILAKDAPAMVQRINREHVQDLFNVAEHLLDVSTEIESVRMTSVDRLGMDIRVTSQQSTRRNKLSTNEFRIGFRIPVVSVEDAKSEILKVFQEAWEKGNDVDWGVESQETPGSTVPILKIAADSLE